MSVEAYMIKWENVPFLFSTLATAKASIELTYPDHLVVGSGSGQGFHVFEVTANGKIQDRITVTEMNLNNEPIKLPGALVRSTAEF